MTVQTDDGRSVRFDLKDYNQIDHGYAATIHKAQGMTVDRVHVLATPGMDAQAAMSPCRGTATAWSCIMAATILRIRTGSSAPCRATGPRTWLGLRTAIRPGLCRAARDYLPRARGRDRAQGRAGEGARDVRRHRTPSDAPGPDGGRTPERETPERERSGTGADRRETEAPEREVAADAEKETRRVRTRALVRHARAVDAVFEAQEMGGEAGPVQVRELQEARKVFEEVRPCGSHDAEAVYKKNPELVHEAARAGSTAPSARFSLKPSCASIRAIAPTASWTLAGARPGQFTPVSGGRHLRR